MKLTELQLYDKAREIIAGIMLDDIKEFFKANEVNLRIEGTAERMSK